jgi:hypothetical protein
VGGGEKVKGKNGEMLSRGPLVGYTTSLALWHQTYTVHTFIYAGEDSQRKLK